MPGDLSGGGDLFLNLATKMGHGKSLRKTLTATCPQPRVFGDKHRHSAGANHFPVCIDGRGELITALPLKLID